MVEKSYGKSSWQTRREIWESADVCLQISESIGSNDWANFPPLTTFAFSNRVNSREVRRVVEEIINESEVKPNTIRFFRGAMFNMVCCHPLWTLPYRNLIFKFVPAKRSILRCRKLTSLPNRADVLLHWLNGLRKEIVMCTQRWKGECRTKMLSP